MSKLFPKSANKLPLQIVIFLAVLGSIATAAVTYYMTPKYTRVGYAPVQPVPFSHAKHVNELGMDCRYCHNGVDKSGHSNVPTAQTCMNCHSVVKKDSPLLAPVRESYEKGTPVPWVWIHTTPDYAYFNHAAHVNRGVSCVECHGPVNQMDTVTHMQPLSMSFCLDCHQNPASRLRDPKDVFNLDSKRLVDQGPAGADQATKLVNHWKVMPPQSCSGCHR
ncbi:cytochrome c3 family protein [Opitutus sp. ER46]|uniref:cytochrome c3 family protein n=1 Tax=Opitutus sp. ER46 TaxID=2161864 RepID=UPI000D302DA3|nr:cytochrome c3 family protein [Opitutus sp. ER46]PTX92618.1 cytochrome C [Opitutus sp. ER46]